jgi:hypothetical protein
VEIMAHDYSSASWKNIKYSSAVTLLTQISYVTVIEFSDFGIGGIGLEITLHDNSFLLPPFQRPVVRLIPPV